MISKYKILFLSSAYLLTGCYHDKPTVNDFDTLVVTPPVSPEEIDEVIDFVDLEKKKDHQGGMPPLIEDPVPETEASLSEGYPAGMEKKVQFWINYFSKKNPKTITRYLNRGAPYKKLIMKLLEEQGLPKDLYYLALIESGFSMKATSRARASGAWQFMKATGKRYGLSINYYVDERWDPVRSTIAASLYLSDLNNVFHSWHLAMAAYNAGEMRIMNAIMRANTRDFWELTKAKRLPRETMNYIPKFIAAAKIGKNPAKYGITIKESEDFDPDSVQVPAPVSLKTIASVSGLSYTSLRKLNPHIKRGITPPSNKEYKLWVPKGSVEKIHPKIKDLAARRLKFKRSLAKTREDIPNSGFHKVRRGETLDSISRKYGMTVSQIRKTSGIKGSRIYPGQKIRVGNSSNKAKTYQRYRVRKGDNLYSIARRFDTTIKDIRKMNRIRRNTIYAGQLLKVKQNRL